MNCQVLFSRENKKNIISLSSACINENIIKTKQIVAADFLICF